MQGSRRIQKPVGCAPFFARGVITSTGRLPDGLSQQRVDPVPLSAGHSITVTLPACALAMTLPKGHVPLTPVDKLVCNATLHALQKGVTGPVQTHCADVNASLHSLMK